MKTALVLGGASCVWEDAAIALEIFRPDAVLAVNDISARWAGHIDYQVTLHPEKLLGWQQERDRRGFPNPGCVIASEHRDGPRIDVVADYRWPGMNASGSSGLFAVKVALDAGADRVVLAGVPMTIEGAHFFTSEGWHQRECFVQGWRDAMPFIKGKVRSMSGWTKELLGAPTPEWLAGDPLA